MSKEKIIYHGLFHDFINYKALIKMQAKSNKVYLGRPEKDTIMNNYYNNKPKVKKLKLHNKSNYYKK